MRWAVERLRLEVERLLLEVERLRVEAERLRVEVEPVPVEFERLRLVLLRRVLPVLLWVAIGGVPPPHRVRLRSPEALGVLVLLRCSKEITSKEVMESIAANTRS